MFGIWPSANQYTGIRKREKWKRSNWIVDEESKIYVLIDESLLPQFIDFNVKEPLVDSNKYTTLFNA